MASRGRGERGLAALACCMATGALAQDAQAPQHSEKIEVIGTNIKRVDAETGLPVQTITRADIDRMGVTNAEELLQKVSAISAGGHVTAVGLGDPATPGLSSVSLRGLGSNNTLVLLNGRRLANFAFNSSNGGGTVNVNQIPLAAVERVEVLKDGASAIYGTDAIGGVINFVLRKDYAGADVSAYGAWTQDGGGDTRKYTATVGYGNVNKDRFNVLAMVEYEKEGELGAWQRSFSKTTIRPDLGVALGSMSTVPANFRVAGVPSPGLVNTTAAQGCDPANGSFQVNNMTGALSPLQPYCTYDYGAVIDITPPSERKGFYGHAVWQVAPEHRAFAEYSRMLTDTLFAVSQTPVTDDGTHRIYYPAGGMYYPTSVTLPDGSLVTPRGNLTIRWRLVPEGRRTDRVKTDEYNWATGLEGTLAGWDYDASVSGAKSHAMDDYVAGYVSITRLSQALQTGIVNIFSSAPQTPQAQALIDAAAITGKVRDSDAHVTAGSAKASREIYDGKYGPVSLALGVDDRREDLEERPQEVLFSGDIQGGGGPIPPTTRASRTTMSFFAELDIPLLRNLDAQLAARYDHFSDFGGTTNPKVALRWTPAPQLLVRASYGTGFRAPTLTDLFLPHFTAYDEGYFDPARCIAGADGNVVPVGPYVSPDECLQTTEHIGGNPAAQPERSRQWSIGAILEPSPGNSLGVDFWTIRRRNSLEALSTDTVFNTFGARDPATAGGRFVRAPRLANGTCQGDGPIPTPADVPCALEYANILIENMGKYNVSGLDVSAAARFVSPEWGKFNAHLDGTYFMQYRYQLVVDGPYYDNVGKAGDNGAVSRWKHYLALDWSRGAWGATIAQNFVYGYQDEDNGSSPPRRVASYETYDVQGSWSGWKGLKVAAGIRNLLNRDPPASRQGETFQVGYDARYYDPLGRTFYLSVKYAFK